MNTTVSAPSKSTAKTQATEIRRHYYRNEFVIVAAARDARPDSFRHAGEPHVVPNPECPFCRAAEPALLVLPDANHWNVRVIANAFPALTLTNPQAYGAMEVVIETPDHRREFSSLPVAHIERVIDAYRQRIAALRAVPGIRYVLVFKNDGPMAGASIAHAHSQIMALPFIPPQVEAEADALNHYWDKNNSCAICDLEVWEREQKVRLIAADEHFTTIAPYAPSYAYETWFIPKRHIAALADLRPGELRALATSLKYVTGKLDHALMSFNFYVSESLPDQDHHLLIKLEPRLPRKDHSGAELGSGVVITSVSPEAAAAWYREPPTTSNGPRSVAP